MRNNELQAWLAKTARRAHAQRRRTLVALPQGHQAATSLATIELRVDEQQRYPCKASGRPFNALTSTPLFESLRKEVWH